jgi:predicted DNA-binding protein (MmcQ/YjbR family)
MGGGMDHAELQRHCLAKPGAWLDQPWEGDHVVKVGAKIFAFLGSSSGSSGAMGGGVGLKCGHDRDEADEWLRRFPDDARQSPYIGRFGWNVLTLGGAIPDDEIREAVDTSYDQVVAKLPKAQRPAG